MKTMRSGQNTAVIIVSLLVISLFASIQTFQVAKAQFEGIEYHGLPVITIQSPKTDEIIASNDVAIVFTIEKPETMWISSVTSNDTAHFNKLSYVEIVIDGNSYKSLPVGSDLSSPYDYSTILTGLTKGTHSLAIRAECEGWDLWYMREFYNQKENYSVSEGITFSVFSVSEPPTEQPTMQPSQPNNHPTNNPQESPMSGSFFTNDSLLIVISITLVVIAFLLAVIIFLLFYMRKRRPLGSKSLLLVIDTKMSVFSPRKITFP